MSCASTFSNQYCGLYAGDWETYYKFKDIFDPLIHEYHGISQGTVHKSDFDVTKIRGEFHEQIPIESIRMRVGRNIGEYGLSPGMSAAQRLAVEDIMKRTLDHLAGELKGSYYSHAKITDKQLITLTKEKFYFKNGDPVMKVAGMEKDWPAGRGIYHNNNNNFLVWVNQEDQVKISSFESSCDIRSTFDRLARGIYAIQRCLIAETGKDFALDPKYGFINSCPTNLGTGFRMSVYLELPGWKQAGMVALAQRCDQLKLQVRAARGDHAAEIGGRFDLSNKVTLGYTEVELVQTVIDGVNQLYREDIELRKKFRIGLMSFLRKA